MEESVGGKGGGCVTGNRVVSTVRRSSGGNGGAGPSAVSVHRVTWVLLVEYVGQAGVRIVYASCWG